MAEFSILPPLLGGALIGLASALLLLSHGRIAGISGILGGLLGPRPGEAGWRAQFLVGMVAGGVVLAFAMPSALAFEVDRSLVVMAAAGLLVGFGTRLGSGCTSGHGVCGLPRLSPRSLVATLTFMATGVLTAVIAGRLLGGAA